MVGNRMRFPRRQPARILHFGFETKEQTAIANAPWLGAHKPFQPGNLHLNQIRKNAKRQNFGNFSHLA